MKFAPLASLKEADLQIDEKAQVTGKTLLTAFRNLFQQLNPYFDSINKLAAKGISLTNNVQCELVTGSFSHGAPQLVSLKTLSRVNGAIGLGANGQQITAAAVAMVQASATKSPLANVTVWFLNPAATNVTCSVLLLPEGQQTGG